MIVVLDENTEPRCSLSRKKNLQHVFDVISKRSTDKMPFDLDSVESLENYIRVSSDPSSSTRTPVEIVDKTKNEEIIEKHFMCQSIEERDSWLRAIRRARYSYGR